MTYANWLCTRATPAYAVRIILMITWPLPIRLSFELGLEAAIKFHCRSQFGGQAVEAEVKGVNAPHVFRKAELPAREWFRLGPKLTMSLAGDTPQGQAEKSKWAAEVPYFKQCGQVKSSPSPFFDISCPQHVYSLHFMANLQDYHARWVQAIQPWRYSRFGSRPPRHSKYHKKLSHAQFLVFQCIWKICLYYSVTY